MKKMIPLLILVCCGFMVAAGYDDGLISGGDYEEFVEWFSGTLIVDGGGGEHHLGMELEPC